MYFFPNIVQVFDNEATDEATGERMDCSIV